MPDKVQDLERILQEHPSDEQKRERFLQRFAFYQGEGEARRLESMLHRMPRMLEHLHTNELIDFAFANASTILRDPSFGRTVVSRLEQEVAAGRGDRDLFWVIAFIAWQLAIPPRFPDASSRARFLRYNRLPDDITFPAEVDHEMADKSVHYYREALAASKGEPIQEGLYYPQLGNLLVKLGRIEEAIAVFESALRRAHPIHKAELFLGYGIALRKTGDIKKAVAALKRVRRHDKEGDGSQPGHATSRAETALGEIALDGGKVKNACAHLMAASRVAPCPHLSTQGLPMELAKRLIEQGRYDCVIDYCRTALTKFTPDEVETQSVLQQALSARQASDVNTG